MTLLVVSPAAANDSARQDGNETLQFGSPVSGTIDETTFRRVYIFTGQADDVISITMSLMEDADLDPYLLLADERGAILAVSDDGGEGLNARIASKRLPANGRYFVIATRFGQEQGNTSGSFELLLERVGAGDSSNTSISYGDSVLGRITAAQPQVFYFLRAARGDVITIEMQRTSGDLDAHLDLATSNGQILASNDDNPLAEGTLDAAIQQFGITKSDVYLIVATRFGRDAGNTEGSFVLSVTRTPRNEWGFTPETALLIEYGMTEVGEITSDAWQRFYSFEANRGDVVTVEIQTIEGNLNPSIRLLTSEYDVLTTDSDSINDRNARIAAYTMPITGTYLIEASRFGTERGQTSGRYDLTLNGRPGVVGDLALEIFYGATVSGQIDTDLVAERYVFFGQAGDVVRISMTRISGDLDSLVTLLDSERKQIAFDDDGGSEDQNALIQEFELSRDDMYIIVASRFDREAGTTSGAYELELELIRSGR